MADVAQYTFPLEEVGEALIKQQGLHEGMWMIAAQFGFGAGLAGPVPSDIGPCAFVQLKSLALVRPTENTPTDVKRLIIDASKVNPR